jgi:uncharacterized protein with ACT and thioredoxin-like domain
LNSPSCCELEAAGVLAGDEVETVMHGALTVIVVGGGSRDASSAKVACSSSDRHGR